MDVMTDVASKLRIRKFKLGKLRISVNMNPRKGIGYRATIHRQSGKWGDSEHSPEEAIGKLLITWAMTELKG